MEGAHRQHRGAGDVGRGHRGAAQGRVGGPQENVNKARGLRDLEITAGLAPLQAL